MGNEALCILYPNAKINLNLHIGNKEKTWWGKDYHRIISLMVPINIYDRMIIKEGEFDVTYKIKNNKNEYEYEYDIVKVDDCIIKKTIEILKIPKEQIKYSIIIEKNIPFASGLGGASSNAAFFIKFLLEKKIIKFNNQEELLKKACEIGSDVPFFIFNKPSIVSGFGEKITLLKEFPRIFFVIFQPFEKISSKLMYEELDNLTERQIIQKKYEKKIIKKIKKNLQNNKNYVSSLIEIANNDFELIVFFKYSEFKNWKLLLTNSLFVQMSGAGSSIFGIYKNFEEAKKCFDNLLNIHGRVYICSCKI